MTAVLIHPTGVGPKNPEATEHWDRTVVNTIAFRGGVVASVLTAGERETLEELHPEGRARFWGAHRRHQAQIDRVSQDDVVVLPGNGRILGLGRVGLVTTNAALGDALWPRRHPEFGSYRHLYSLTQFLPVDMPLAALRDAGVRWFQTPTYIDDARVDAILANLEAVIPPALNSPALSPIEREIREVQKYEAADDAVARDLNWVRELEIEVVSIGAVPVRARASGVMHRGENLLVHAYAASLYPGARRRRFNTPAGMTDLDVFLDDRHELVEAKSSAGRVHVRQALAQLLDYAPALGDRRPHSLAALFPSRPDDSAIDLLHRYGVTCIYRTTRGTFERLDAPVSAGQAIARLW